MMCYVVVLLFLVSKLCMLSDVVTSHVRDCVARHGKL